MTTDTYKVMATGKDGGWTARVWNTTADNAERWFHREFGPGYVLVGPTGETVARP